MWEPLQVNPNIRMQGSFIKGRGYYLLDLNKRLIDNSYLFPTKAAAYGECGRRNNTFPLLDEEKEND
jgi:hypothetical protein